MTPPEVSDFFSINIIDLSLLEDITLEDILTYRHMAEYHLLVGPSNPNQPHNALEQHTIKSCNNFRWHIASMKGNNKFYIPEAHYQLVNVTDKVNGITISIRNIKILYINLNDCDHRDIIRVYSMIEKLHVPQYMFNLICLQHQEKTYFRNPHNWTEHQLDSKTFCLNYTINFQILISKNKRSYNMDLNQIWTQDISGQSGNVGIEIHIPYIDDNILNILERCYIQNIYPKQPPA